LEKWFGKIADNKSSLCYNMTFTLGLSKKLWGVLKAAVFQPVEREITLLCYADVFQEFAKRFLQGALRLP
jgi:hypothetical protein